MGLWSYFTTDRRSTTCMFDRMTFMFGTRPNRGTYIMIYPIVYTGIDRSILNSLCSNASLEILSVNLIGLFYIGIQKLAHFYTQRLLITEN